MVPGQGEPGNPVWASARAAALPQRIDEPSAGQPTGPARGAARPPVPGASTGLAAVGGGVGGAPIYPSGGTTGSVAVGAAGSASVTPGVRAVRVPAGKASVAIAPVRPLGITDTGERKLGTIDATGAEQVTPGRGGLGGNLRRTLRERRRLRMIALLTISLVVLGALPLFFGIRTASRDPVFAALDDLDVAPQLAAETDDRSTGNRWCLLECRFRERSAHSSEPVQQTMAAYQAALTRAGWQPWKVAGCPDEPTVEGSYTCWRRDEFTLDLWVRAPACPEADQQPADGQPTTSQAAACAGAEVSIKVQDAIADNRGRPGANPGPGLVGETPDATPAVDPLKQATPTPS